MAQRKITLDTGYTTYWDAYAQFCRAAGLTEKDFDQTNEETQVSYNPRRFFFNRRMMWGGFPGQCVVVPSPPLAVPAGLVLTEGKPAVRPTCQVGGLRLRALTPSPALNPWRAIQGDGEVILGLEALTEPNLVWQGVQSLHVEKAVDDKGQVLIQPEDYMNGAYSDPDIEENFGGTICLDGTGPTIPGGGGQRVPLRLRLGSRPATKLKDVQGTVTVRLSTAPETIATLDRVLQSAGKSVKGSNGTVLSLVEVQPLKGGRWRLRVQIDVPQAEAQNFFFGGIQAMPWGIGNMEGPEEASSPGNGGPLLLLDTNGHLVRRTEVENLDDGNGMEGAFRLTYQPAPGQAEPSRLVLQGRRSVLVEVPFHFQDVPLPK
jgi:hypothetical protein